MENPILRVRLICLSKFIPRYSFSAEISRSLQISSASRVSHLSVCNYVSTEYIVSVAFHLTTIFVAYLIIIKSRQQTVLLQHFSFAPLAPRLRGAKTICMCVCV